MGKGDKKSRKGKIRKGTYGNSRPRKKKKSVARAGKASARPKAKKTAKKSAE